MQSGLIAGLLMQRSRRRRAEGALRANEQALQVSQEDTRRLAGRIIAAQEVERARIARELHDDISQKVALLAMDIHQIGLSDAPGVRGRANIMAERDSRDRHGSPQSLARASSREAPDSRARAGDTVSLPGSRRTPSSSSIDFVHDRMPSNVPPEPALCLFRIVQEALQNVVRHSGARTASRQADRFARIAAARDFRFRQRLRHHRSWAMGWAC